MRWFAAAVLWPLPALAQNSGGDALLTVVVTPQRADAEPFDVPASVNIVRLGDETRAAVNLSETLDGIPGVLARDRQNYAQDLQISVRGFGTRAPFGIVGTRIYVDGIPATQPDGVGQVSHVNLDSASRVEVLRGPFSVLYGNASGGVIQVSTAEGTAPPTLETDLVTGGNGLLRGSLNLRGASGPLDYNADYTHFQTDGSRAHSGAKRESGNIRAGLALGGGTRLTLIANTVYLPEAEDALGLDRLQYETDPGQATPQAFDFNTRKTVEQTQAGVILDHDFSSAHALRVLLYYGQRDVEQFLAIPPGPQGNARHSGGVVDLANAYGGTDVRWSYRGTLGQGALNLAVGVTHDRLDSHRRGYNNFIGATTGVKGTLRRDEINTIYTLDPYVQAGWEFTPDAAVVAGLRRSQVRFDSVDRFITAANPDDSGSRSYTEVTPALGLRYRLTPASNFYAAYGEGFDSPTFAELTYQPSGAGGLNFALQPARTRNSELGYKWRGAAGVQVNAALFHADTRDEIVVANAQGGRTTYQNAGRSRRQGVEFDTAWQVNPSHQLQLAYTWLDSGFRDAFLTCAAACPAPNVTVDAGNRIPGVPRTQLFGEWRGGRETGWSATLDGRFLSRVAVNSTNTEFAPAYGLFGASVGYIWPYSTGRLRVYLRGDNLLDRTYVGSVIVNDTNGRFYEPGPTRTALAGLAWRWKIPSSTE